MSYYPNPYHFIRKSVYSLTKMVSVINFKEAMRMRQKKEFHNGEVKVRLQYLQSISAIVSIGSYSPLDHTHSVDVPLNFHM